LKTTCLRLAPLRAVIRVHKEVLALQTEVWKLCIKSSLNAKEFDESFNAVDAATARAHQVYKRYATAAHARCSTVAAELGGQDTVHACPYLAPLLSCMKAPWGYKLWLHAVNCAVVRP
jgi:hypothetical protein